MENCYLNIEYLLTTSQIQKFPNKNLPEFLFLGRSNVGKSTFINSISNNKKLAKISKMPGKTKALSFFIANKNFILVDAPGYGFAKVSNNQKIIHQNLMKNYFDFTKNLKSAVLFLDGRRNKLSSEDKMIIELLKNNNISFFFNNHKKR